jgi:putative FmdB family regulatory protein
MPIYEYECQGCGEVTEKLQKISDKPLRKCPCCGGSVKKLMSMNTFHLKGSGWYVTDYAGKKAPPTETAAKSESSTKTETKTDTSKKDKKKD